MEPRAYALATLASWSAFAAFWLLLRNRVKEAAEAAAASPSGSGTGRQRAVPVLGIALYLGLLYWPLLPPAGAQRGVLLPAPWSGQVGLALCLFGVALSIWARWVLGRNWSGGVVEKKDHELVDAGPYRWVRHPIYTGAIVAILGSAIAVGHPSGFVVVLLVWAGVVVKMGKEEELLNRVFPGRYAAYRRRTKKLVPFVW